MVDETTEGRQPVVIVELDQDFCQLEYGVAPCTAAIGTTGARKCFNTLASCQDDDNYDRGTLTLRFCTPQVEVPAEWNAIPSLRSTSTAPTRLNPGANERSSKPLGKRASITITLNDHPHTDFRVDPYVTERSYEPLERGTFWSKWLARNPYYQNRRIRVREGYLGQNLEDMRTRHYFIDSIDGPDGNARVKIKAKDVLKLADNERAQAPRGSQGELSADLNDTATSFVAAGAIDGEYPTGGGTIRVNDEVMTYSSGSWSAGEFTFSGVTRGTDNTEADEHDEGDTVQLCYRVTNEDCWIVAQELLEDYGNVPSEFIPISDWSTEGNQWLPQFTITSLVTEPTGVTDLLGEICEQCQFYIWWDERAQEVKLKALRPPSDIPTVINDDANVLEDSFSISTEPDERVSQVWLYYDQRVPTEDVDEESNYRRLRIRIDEEAERDREYGERRIKKLFARWIETDAQAVNLSTRILSRYRDNPRYAKVMMDAKDRAIWTGDIVDASVHNLVDLTGAIATTRFQVISAEEVQSGTRLEYEMLTFPFVGRFAFWMAEDAPPYDLATDEELRNGGWWARADGTMPDGADGWEWQ